MNAPEYIFEAASKPSLPWHEVPLIRATDASVRGYGCLVDDPEGFVRLVSREDDHVVLGIQATGPGVSELVSGFALVLEAGLRVEDIAGTIHAHPTLGEALQEAALAAASTRSLRDR